MIINVLEDVLGILQSEPGLQVMALQDGFSVFRIEIYGPCYSYCGINEMVFFDCSDIKGLSDKLFSLSASDEKVNKLFDDLRQNNTVFSDDYMRPVVQKFVSDYYASIGRIAKKIGQYAVHPEDVKSLSVRNVIKRPLVNIPGNSPQNSKPKVSKSSKSVKNNKKGKKRATNW